MTVDFRSAGSSPTLFVARDAPCKLVDGVSIAQRGDMTVPEKIKIGGLELEFLHSKEDTEGSLDLFRMTVQANAKVPAPHYHESWDEAVYGLSGTLTFRIGG